VHEAHSRDRRNSPGQPPPPTHVVAHPDQALMTKYYSTVTQTDQAGSGPPTQTNTQAAGTPGPNPSTTNPNEQSDAVPWSRAHLHRDKKRKTAERVTMPEPHGGTHRP
jgi:hypothetical protein